MTRRKLIVALAAAGALAAVLLWPKGREVDVVAVRQAPLTQSVVATGRIATPARISIGSPLAATVLEVTVREGDPVKPGSLVVSIHIPLRGCAVRAARCPESPALRARSHALPAQRVCQ